MATLEAQIEKFLALPRSKRREEYKKLDRDAQKAARAASEKRRGIAFRTADGAVIFSKEVLLGQALHLADKAKVYGGREKSAKARLVELKKQALEVYGDDFLAEVETALEQ